MNVRTLLNRLRALLRKGRLDRDLDDELAFHVAMRRADQVHEGVAPADADRAAARQFGNVLRTKERTRDVWVFAWFEGVLQDVRLAARTLRRAPGFALVAILTLAVGIGASTVGFSVFYGLLFNGFAAKDLSRLVVPVTTSPTMAATVGIPYNATFTLRDFIGLREQSHVFEDLAGYSSLNNVVYTDGELIDQTTGAAVTPNALTFYGVPPLLGRGIMPEDGGPEAPLAFVMSHRLWSSRFASDPALIGKTFIVNGQPRVLVGVMPPGVQAYGAQLWFPIQASADPSRVPVAAFGRLKPGVSIDDANADIEVVIKQVLRASFTGRPGSVNDPNITSARVLPASDYLLGLYGLNLPQGAVYAVFAAVLLLLLIACSNIANLLLARSTARERELAVRIALGAGRARLVRQLMTESGLLSAAACITGSWFAYLSLTPVANLLVKRGVATETATELNAAALAFAIIAAAFTLFVCGVIPAWRAIRIHPQTTLVGGSKGTLDWSGSHRLRRAFVIAQVALAVMLLVGAGLMFRTLYGLTTIDLGFDPTHRIVAGLTNVGRPFQTAEQRQALMRPIVDRLGQVPGVTDVAVTAALPGYGSPSSLLVIPGGQPGDAPIVKVDLCDETLFATLGLRFLSGRALSAADVSQGRRVAIVNETFVRRFHDHDDPIGRTFRLGAYAEGAPLEIIGVVADVKNLSPISPTLPMAYLPFTIPGPTQPGVLIRTAVRPDIVVEAVKQHIWAVMPNVGIDATSVEEALHRFTFAAPRFASVIMGALALVAVLLVVTGVFSVMAYVVALRTHEIGVRMAVGASATDVVRMMMKSALVPVAIGCAIGTVMSVGLTQILESQLWGVSSRDPSTFIGAMMLMVVTGVVASILPALRSARVDPVVALRCE